MSAEARRRTHLEDRRVCWKCGELYPEEVAICVRCGVDLRTGERLETNPEPDEVLTGGERALQLLCTHVPGLFMPGPLIWGIAAIAVGGAVIFFALKIMMLAVIGAIMMGGAGLVVYAHGPAWILGGEIGFLPSVLVDFTRVQWALFFLAICGSLIGFVMGMFAS